MCLGVSSKKPGLYMAPRIDWKELANIHGYESLPVMLLDFAKQFGVQRAAVRLGISETSYSLKMRQLGLRFQPLKIWHVHRDWPYVAIIRKAGRARSRSRTLIMERAQGGRAGA